MRTALIGFVLALLALPAAAQSDAAHQQFLFAYKLLQRGEQQLAGQAFDEYLGRFPDDAKRADAMYYRALLHRQAGRNDAAAELLRQAGEPTLVPTYALDLLRGQVLTDLQRYDEALAALERIEPGGLQPAAAASAWYLRGLAYRGAENLPAAERALSEAVSLDSPVRVRAAVDLARVQALLDQPGRAMKTLDAALSIGGAEHAAEAARLLGDLHQQQGEHEAAIAAYQRVITAHQSSPQFGPAITGTLWSQLAAGRHDAVLQAHARFRDLLMPEHRTTADYLAGSAAAALGRHADAARWFETMLASQAADPALREKALYKLATSQFELDRFDAMRGTITRLGQAYPQSELLVDAAFLIAAARAEGGSVSEAAAALGELIDQGPTSPYYSQALLRRASLYEQHDQPAKAAKDYVAYLEHQAQGPRAATEQEAGAFLRLLDLYQRLGQDAYAEALASDWLAHMGLAPAAAQEATYRLALSQMRQQKLDAALATLDRLDASDANPFAPQSTYYRGLILASLGRPVEANAPLQRAADLEALPTPLRANALRLLALHRRQADDHAAAEKALARLEALVGRAEMRPDELLYLAQRALARQDARAALTIASHLTERPGLQGTPTLGEALLVAGRAHRQLGELDQAMGRFEHASAVSPDLAMDARLELARTARAAGRETQALDELEGLASAASSRIAAWALYESAMANRSLAMQRRRQDDAAGEVQRLDEARRLLKKLVLLYPVADLLPLPQMAYVQLADIALDAGQPDVARAELDEMLRKFGQGPWATLGRAQQAMARGRLGEAKALAQQVDASGDASLAAMKADVLAAVEGRS